MMNTQRYQTTIATLILICLALLTVMPLYPTHAAHASARFQPHGSGTIEDRLAAIDAYVEQERQAARVPGIALAIVQDDRIVHLRGFGEADSSGRTVTPRTPFVLGSASKSFTALAVMQLVEAGKIDLDAPVQRYVRWFRVADPEASARITVRHLLNHTSGLPRGTGNSEMATSRDMRDGALEEQVRSFSTAELSQPVGTTWQYSNAGYVTLGLLVQIVSGLSYEDYVQQHILAPLEMEHTFTDPAKARAAGLAAGYRYWFGQPVSGDAPFNRQLLPAGLLISSAEDVAHYLVAQLNDGHYTGTALLSPAGMAEMQRAAVPVPGEEARYGMGWYVGERNGIAVVSHPGDTAHYHADIMLVPESRYGIALLMNSNNRMTGERMRGIVGGVLSLLHDQQPPVIEQNTSATDVFRIMMGLAVLQLLAIIWSAISLRRLVKRGPGAVQGWLRISWYLLAPLVFYLLLSLIFLVGVPLLFTLPWPLLLLSLPDVGAVALAAGVAALGWIMIRTAVLVRVLRRRTSLVVAPRAAPTTPVQTT